MLKGVLATVIFLSALFKLYSLYTGGRLVKDLEMRDQYGFLLEDPPALVASPAQQKAYRDLLAAPKIKPAASAEETVGKLSEPEAASTQPQVEDEVKKSPEEPVAKTTKKNPKAKARQTSEPADPKAPKKKTYRVNCQTRNSEGLMPNVVWKRLVEKAGKEFVILETDTDLTALARDVMGGEECWPKIWSLNPQIQNPHDVPAGTRVNFTN